ncbi:MAG TPA: hypothetical protein PKA05_10535 [Roseiflexaceae bacterium]|nr:hypothetical protein [Roseiflexaceae bacterium]
MVFNQSDAVRLTLQRFQRIALIVGVAALLLGIVGWFMSGSQFFYSYLFAYFFWMLFAMGGLLVLMIESVTDGVWGLMLRRHLESAAMTLPLMALLFVPIIVGMGDLYIWTHPEEVAANYVIARKEPYLNTPFFLVRAVIYFVVWIGLAYMLYRVSNERDRTGNLELRARMRSIAGPGIVALALTRMLAATDWGMSAEPEWFSSMYPVTFIAGMLVTTFAFAIIVMTILSKRNMLPYAIPVDRLHDLGKFMFAFIVVWAYINFSQYLIIWSGNIPEETFWYGHRLEHGWEVPALMLLFGHFFVPFFLLLSRHAKRNINFLSIMAAYMIGIELVFVFWTIMPSFYPDGFHIHWLDVVMLVALGGLWLGVYARNLASRSLLPLHDGRLELLAQQQQSRHGHGGHKDPAAAGH